MLENSGYEAQTQQNNHQHGRFDAIPLKSDISANKLKGKVVFYTSPTKEKKTRS